MVGLYDPLLAKVCVWDVDRERARLRMLRALDELVVEGVTTLAGFHKALLRHPCFVEATTCHGLVESEELAEQAQQLSHRTTSVARPPDGRLQERVVEIELDGRRYERQAPPARAAPRGARPPPAGASGRRCAPRGGEARRSSSPMQGTVLAVEVAEGEEVRAGQVVCIVEAMKMENEIRAHRHGTVGELSVAAGAQVVTGQVICVVTQEGNDAEPL